MTRTEKLKAALAFDWYKAERDAAAKQDEATCGVMPGLLESVQWQKFCSFKHGGSFEHARLEPLLDLMPDLVAALDDLSRWHEEKCQAPFSPGLPCTCRNKTARALLARVDDVLKEVGE